MRASACVILAVIGIMALMGTVRAQDGEGVEDRFRSTIDSWIAFFEGNIAWISQTMIEFMKNVIKATYFALGMAGFLLWATGLSKYSGKRLIMGAVILALISEIIL